MGALGAQVSTLGTPSDSHIVVSCDGVQAQTQVTE